MTLASISYRQMGPVCFLDLPPTKSYTGLYAIVYIYIMCSGRLLANISCIYMIWKELQILESRICGWIWTNGLLVWVSMTSPEDYEFVVPDYCLWRVYARTHLVQSSHLIPNRSLSTTIFSLLYHRPANPAVEFFILSTENHVFGVVLYVLISLSHHKNQSFTAAPINDWTVHTFKRYFYHKSEALGQWCSVCFQLPWSTLQ